MLKEVSIDTYRSCVSVHIADIGGMLALLGRNGSGKTNILRAIEWACRSATSTEVVSLHRAQEESRLSLEVHLDQFQFKYSIRSSSIVRNGSTSPGQKIVEPMLNESVEVRHLGDASWHHLVERTNEEVTLNGNGGLKIGQAIPCIPALASILPADNPVVLRLHSLRVFLAGVRYYPLDEPFRPLDDTDRRGVVPGDDYALWLSKLKSSGDSGDSVLLRILHMHQERPEQFEELCSLLGKTGLGIIDRILVQKIETPTTPRKDQKAEASTRIWHFVIFRPSGAEGQFNFGDLSIGTRRVIRILVSMLFDGSTVLLMEQPEDAIHSALMRKLTGVLKSNADPLQFILASHSSSVFNQLSPDEVRLVSMNNGVTSLRPLTAKERNAAIRHMQREGSLSDFLEIVEEN